MCEVTREAMEPMSILITAHLLTYTVMTTIVTKAINLDTTLRITLVPIDITHPFILPTIVIVGAGKLANSHLRTIAYLP